MKTIPLHPHGEALVDDDYKASDAYQEANRYHFGEFSPYNIQPSKEGN